MTGGPRKFGLRDVERTPADDELLLDGFEARAPAPAGEPDSIVTSVVWDAPPLADESAAPSEEPIAEPVPQRGGWIAPAVVAVLVVVWLAAAAWMALLPTIAGGDPALIVVVIAAMCVPPVLIGMGWLLLRLSSANEARRFADTAAAMRAESAALERAVAMLGERVEANRAALGEQTRQMLALGEDAQERLGAIGRGLSHASDELSGSARQLDDAANGADRRLEILLRGLPAARGELADAAAQLDRASLSVGERAAQLDAQLTALGERGREADQVAGGAAQRLAAYIARMEATSETAGARLEGVAEEMSATIDAVLDRAGAAVDESRRGIAAQGDALLAMLSSSHAAMDKASRETVQALQAQLGDAEAAIGRLGDQLAAERDRGAALTSELEAGIGAVETRLVALHAGAAERNAGLAASISALTGSADAMGEAMRSGELLARQLIATAEDVLTAMDASAREIDETLPEALARLDRRLAESRAGVTAAKPELLALVTAAESTHDAIEAIGAVVAQQRDTLNGLATMLRDSTGRSREEAEALARTVEEAIARSSLFSEQTAPQLAEGLARLRESATVAAERAREALAGVIPDAARALEHAAADAVERAGARAIEAQLDAIGAAADEAAARAEQAAKRLEERAGALVTARTAFDARMAEADAAQAASDRDTLSRRVAVLVEALNSAAIDIARTFDHDVTDSAWAAYLKGDRGVFTRRAVRLLDSHQAREIGMLYDSDEAFREHANRYIHDFEAMLRQILHRNENSPLAVTLLSSDMGKLYVALAQATERLRT